MASPAIMLLFLALSLLAVRVAAQINTPASYSYDCRRSNVGCSNEGKCSIADDVGICDCTNAVGFEGQDCTFQTDQKAEDSVCVASPCQNNGVCLQGGTCYCNSNTYGSKCENPRIKMWCDNTGMFININPHGNFEGNVYIRKQDGTGKSDSNCLLTKIIDTQPVLTSYAYVKTVNDETPVLQGYYIGQVHEPAEGATDSCQAASKRIETGRTDYIQQVLIEYDKMLVSSVDQIVNLNCSIIESADAVTSENAMSVTLNDDDYKPVNVTDTIEPVLFLIRDPDTDTVITNNVYLGDPLDLTFTLQAAAAGDPTPVGTSIQGFKVTQCSASDGQPTTPPAEGETEEVPFVFLDADCPTDRGEMLYRDMVQQTTDTVTGIRKTVIPISAFRFVGNVDMVAFSCSIELCTADSLTANPAACDMNDCGTDGGDGGDGGDNGESENGGGGPPEDPGNPNEGERRKRSADDHKNVNATIKVINPLGSKQTGTGDGPEKEAETEDCMQQSEVIIIIVIFAVILILVLCALVIVVVHLLRSRQKVVDVSHQSVPDPQSRYTLPRLSLTTNM